MPTYHLIYAIFELKQIFCILTGSSAMLNASTCMQKRADIINSFLF